MVSKIFFFFADESLRLYDKWNYNKLEIFENEMDGDQKNYAIETTRKVLNAYDNHFKCANYIYIPKNVSFIDNNAFSSCSRLKNIIIPENITFIANGLFYYCDKLEFIQIPESVISIGYESFAICSNLKSFPILKRITSIGSSAFKSGISLQNITLSN